MHTLANRSDDDDLASKTFCLVQDREPVVTMKKKGNSSMAIEVAHDIQNSEICRGRAKSKGEASTFGYGTDEPWYWTSIISPFGAR